MARPVPIAAAAAAAALAMAGGAAWWVVRPKPLGLETPRVVVATGDAAVGDKRARAAEAFASGSTVKTGRGTACVSLRASRVCVGANSEVTLGDPIEARRGTILAAPAGDEIRVRVPSGVVAARSGAFAIEDVDGRDPIVRALEGGTTLQPTGKDARVLTAPDVAGIKDESPATSKRPAAPDVEREEAGVLALARRWQGSAGAVVTVGDLRPRVEVDGVTVGLGPASVLLDEGDHVLVLREGLRETSREALRLKAGSRVERP